MGCAGSKNEIRHTEHPSYKNPVPKVTKKEMEKDDEEVQIVQQGKNLNNSALDELTEKNISISKTQPNPISSPNKSRNIEKPKEIDKELHSKTINVSKMKNENNEDLENPSENKKLNQSTEVPSLKSKTVKVEFEKHPHEFDFSFIEDDEENAKKKEDLLTDQVLKEISEIN